MNAPGDDPYACLGISPGASLPDIRRAYKKSVQRLHPDRNPSPDAHTQFLKVQWAYRVLLENPYGPFPGSGEDPPPPNHPNPPPRSPVSPRSPPKMGGKESDATVVVNVPLEEAGLAHEHLISAKLAQSCPQCGGNGGDCSNCAGTGQVLKLRKWRVVIPPRTPDGAWIVGAHMGHRGPRFGSAGDVRVQVRWTEAGIWKWERSSLVAHVRLSTRKMKRGGVHPLRMPDGRWVWWTVPANTIRGQVFEWGVIEWAGMTSPASIVVEACWSLFSPRGRRPPRKR